MQTKHQKYFQIRNLGVETVERFWSKPDVTSG